MDLAGSDLVRVKDVSWENSRGSMSEFLLVLVWSQSIVYQIFMSLTLYTRIFTKHVQYIHTKLANINSLYK